MTPNRSKARGLFPEDREESAPKKAEPKPEEGSVSDEYLRITAYLSPDQVDHLDHERIRIRRSTRQVLERTGMIRGLVEGLRLSGLDLAELGAATEEEVAAIVEERLSRGDS